MNTITLVHTVYPDAPNLATQGVYETAFKRRLVGELNEMQGLLGGEDTLSKQIAEWHQSFQAALRTDLNIQPILQDYVRLLRDTLVDSLMHLRVDKETIAANPGLWQIYHGYAQLLQRILMDPFTLVPLDEEALLGSDGNCYGYHMLCLFMSILPQEYRSRSPFFLQDPTIQEKLMTEPHTLARHMVRWLKSHDGMFCSPEIEEEFSVLKEALGDRQVRRLIPNERNDRLLRIQNRARERMAQGNSIEAVTMRLGGVKETIKTNIQQEFADISERVDKFAEQKFAELEQIEQQNQREFRRLEERVRHIEEKQQILEREIEELEDQITDVGNKIEQARFEELEVKLEIKKLEEAIERRKKKQAQAVWQTLAAVGACALATFLAGSPHVAFLPENGGGAISLIKPI